MAKKKENVINFAEIAKSCGGMTLSSVGEVPYFIDSGNLALNFICSGRFVGGGYPGGRITEVFGPAATAKSLLGYCALASCQRMGGIAILLDCERASSANFAKTAGHCNPDEIVVCEPAHIKAVEDKIKHATKAIRSNYGPDKPILFVWDSIGVSPTEREWSGLDLPENPTAAQLKAVGQSRPGERARASGDLLRLMNPFMNDHNASLFVINQLRSNIGVMYGPSDVTAGGGRALVYYTSCRLGTNIGKMIESKYGMPLGVNLRFANKKSRSSTPGIKTEGIQLFFKKGINPLGGLLSVLLAAERIKPASKGYYEVMPEWSEGKEVKFQASLVRNDVPIDVLLEAPLLVDCKTKEVVTEYLTTYQGAIDLANGAIVEKEPEKDSDIVSQLAAQLDLDEEEN